MARFWWNMFFHGNTVAALFMLLGCVTDSLQDCFSQNCTHTNGLSECSQGTYLCQASEFCEITMYNHHDGTHMIILDCRPNIVWADCQAGSAAKGCTVGGQGHGQPGVCHWCCHDQACVHQLAQDSVATSPPPPGKESCFTSDCPHHADFAHCAAGSYACHADEYCNLQTLAHGELHMKCEPIAHKMTDCLTHATHNDASCSSLPLPSPPSHNCQFCCADEACILHVLSHPQGNATQAAVAAATTAAPLQPGKASCFTSDCPHHSDFAHCAAGSYACHADEFCQVQSTAHGDVHMTCEPVGHKLTECQNHVVHNNPSCSSLPLPSPPSHNCLFCCATAACVFQVFSQPAGTSLPRRADSDVSITLPPQADVVTTVLHAGRESCFTSDCPHHSDFAHCAAGSYACHADEFCHFSTTAHGDIHMKCEPELRKLECETHATHNHAGCNSLPLPSPPTQNCQFCCADEACVFQKMSHPVAVTTAPSSAVSGTPAVAATTAPHPAVTAANHASVATTTAVPLHAGKASCFTSDCQHHSSFAHCAAGSYACHADEYCHLNSNSNGDIHMHCEPKIKMTECQTQAAIHNDASCNSLPLPSPPSHNCQVCCADEACILHVMSHPATASLSATTSLPASVSHQLTGCFDHLPGNDCQHFANCSDPRHATVCPMTCNKCAPTTILTSTHGN